MGSKRTPDALSETMVDRRYLNSRGLVIIGDLSPATYSVSVQGYLAHKRTPTPLGPSYDPRHRPTVGS